MATLHFHEPDRTGHRFGPDSQEVKLKVEYMDGTLGYLMNRFDEHNLWESVNVIVTSDHGMAEIDLKNRLIDITEYVNMSMIKATIDNGALMQIFPSADNLVDDIFNALYSSHPNMTVYKKGDIPQRWHYGDNRRVAPIVAVADRGWSITKNRTMAAAFAGYRRGGHGYDNEVESMRSIFLARGPSLKTKYSMEPFSSLDLYPLLCSLLGIHPAPNNGSLGVVSKMIIESPAICGGQTTIGHFGLLFSLLSLFTLALY
ncbi:hypothetical protein ScPMuIL_003903 [Solemya velum]